MDKTEEMEACPFCGVAATGAHKAGSAWFIDCEHEPTCIEADFQRTEAEAIAAWNKRATLSRSHDSRLADEQSPLSILIEAMHQKLDSLVHYPNSVANDLQKRREQSIDGTIDELRRIAICGSDARHQFNRILAALRSTPAPGALRERVERAIELRRYLFGGEPLNTNERNIVEGIRTAVLEALRTKGSRDA